MVDAGSFIFLFILFQVCTFSMLSWDKGQDMSKKELWLISNQFMTVAVFLEEEQQHVMSF